MLVTPTIQTTRAATIRIATGVPPLLRARFMPGRGTARPLLALHGISREAVEMFDAFAAPCAAADRALLTPRFGPRSWPVFQRVHDRNRPGRAVLELLDIAVREHAMPAEPVDVFGYSGGAQLAHRLAMLYPERVGALHLGAAGWYTLPDADLPYPLGLGADRRGRDAIPACMRSGLAAFLDRRIALYVGDRDADPADPAMRRAPEIDAAQGVHRRARAERVAEAIAAAQRSAGLPVTVTLTLLAGCGHDFAQCAAQGGLAARVAAT